MLNCSYRFIRSGAEIVLTYSSRMKKQFVKRIYGEADAFPAPMTTTDAHFFLAWKIGYIGTDSISIIAAIISRGIICIWIIVLFAS